MISDCNPYIIVILIWFFDNDVVDCDIVHLMEYNSLKKLRVFTRESVFDEIVDINSCKNYFTKDAWAYIHVYACIDQATY